MQNGDVYEANIKDIDKKSDIATIKVNPQVRPPENAQSHEEHAPAEFSFGRYKNPAGSWPRGIGLPTPPSQK